MEIYLVKRDFALYPAADEDAEKVLKMKRGEVFKCEIRQARNYQFHRKYFSLVNCAWEYLNEKEQESFIDVEHFRKQIEMAAGWCDTVYSYKRSEFVDSPKSISFGKMTQEQFDNLYTKVKDVIFGLVLKGKIDEQDFMDNLSTY
jgi:hypothetical protein